MSVLMKELKTETETKARRLAWSVQNNSLDWDLVVFTGFKKIGPFKVWGAISTISRLNQCPLHVFIGPLKNKQCKSILDDFIFRMWTKNRNMIFTQVRFYSSLLNAECKY